MKGKQIEHQKFDIEDDQTSVPNSEGFQEKKTKPMSYIQVEDIEQKNNNSEEVYYGNAIVCCFFMSEPRITLGPHWPLFLCTWACFVGANYIVSQTLAQKHSDVWYIITLLINSIQNLSYLLTALKNPGIVSRNMIKSRRQLEGQRVCTICRVSVDDYDTYHCYDCDVCIVGFDHHCPWTGKCIGRGNMFFFQVFITFTMIFFINAIFLVAA